MSQIFISYSRKDLAIAEKIIDALGDDDLEPWIDWKSIPKGETFEGEIKQGIEKAQVFLFLVSPDSVQSYWCNMEIEHAVNNGKRILPIVVRDTDVQFIHLEISRRNWILCRDEQDDFNKAIEETRNTIRTDYEWLKFHTRLQNEALVWERSGKETSYLLHEKELKDTASIFVISSGNEPSPTDIQRQYILASQINEESLRKIEERRRRQITFSLTLGLIIVTVLVFFAWAQRNTAISETNAKATALINEENANATAQAEKIRAEEQSNIALARQFAAQANSIFNLDSVNQTIAGLLAVQSMKLMPNYESSVLLQGMTFSAPVAHMEQTDTISPVAFSPDSKLVAYGGVNTLRVWDFTTDKVVAQMDYDGRISSLSFTFDGKYVVTSGCDSIRCSVQIWEVSTGNKLAQIIQEGDDDRFRAPAIFALNPNGRYVAVSNSFQPVSIWEIPTGHGISYTTHPADSIAFSPDGKYIASNGSATLSVWGVATNQEVFHINDTSLGGPVVFSPDGKYIVSGGNQSEPGATARVWEITTGLEVSRMNHDCSAVESVAFNPDGNYVVSGSCDDTARVWATFSGKEIARMTHGSFVKYVAFSPDGRYVISAGYQDPDRTARVWDPKTGKEIARLVHGTGVYEIAFSPDGRYVVSSGCEEEKAFDQCLRAGVSIWNVKGTEIFHMKHDDEGSGLDIQVSPDGKYIVSKGQYTIRVWDVTTGKEVFHVMDEATFGNSFSISPDSKYISAENWGWEVWRDSGISESMIRVWEISSGKEINRIYTDSGRRSISFSPDGRYIIAAEIFDNHVGGIWETTSSRMITTINTYGRSSSVEFNRNGTYAASATARDSILIWNTSSGKEVSRINSDVKISEFKFSTNNDHLLNSIGADNTLHVWDIMTGEEIGSIAHENDPLLLPDTFSLDGKYVLLHSLDNIYRVWETTNGKEISRMILGGDVYSVSFSPDGQYIVSNALNDTATLDTVTRVWKTDTGEEIAPLAQEGSGSPLAIFTPDGNFWAVEYADTIHIWDIHSKKELSQLLHDNLSDFTFSPDGKYIISTDFDHTIHVWVWQPSDLITESCSRITRNITRSEWRQYIGDALPYQAICPNLPIEPEITITSTP